MKPAVFKKETFNKREIRAGWVISVELLPKRLSLPIFIKADFVIHVREADER